MRDWERGYDEPSLTHAMSWAYTLQFRFTLIDRLGEVAYAPLPLDETNWQMQEYRRFAEPLKARRRKRNLSQTDLGVMIGITRSTMQRWEDGEQMPRFLTFIAWADKIDFAVALVKMK